MRETYRVEYRIADDDRWRTWNDIPYDNRLAAKEWARALPGGRLNGAPITAARVVTVTEQYEIVHPPKEHTDA